MNFLPIPPIPPSYADRLLASYAQALMPDYNSLDAFQKIQYNTIISLYTDTASGEFLSGYDGSVNTHLFRGSTILQGRTPKSAFCCGLAFEHFFLSWKSWLGSLFETDVDLTFAQMQKLRSHFFVPPSPERTFSTGSHGGFKHLMESLNARWSAAKKAGSATKGSMEEEIGLRFESVTGEENLRFGDYLQSQRGPDIHSAGGHASVFVGYEQRTRKGVTKTYLRVFNALGIASYGLHSSKCVFFSSVPTNRSSRDGFKHLMWVGRVYTSGSAPQRNTTPKATPVVPKTYLDLEPVVRKLGEITGLLKDYAPKDINGITWKSRTETEIRRLTEEVTKKVPTRGAVDPLWVSALRSLQATLPNAARNPSRTATDVDRLYTQLLLPELYFAIPPACNVLFPEHIVSLDFSKDQRNEITRMRVQLKSFLTGGGTGTYQRDQQPTELLGSYYYAPDIQDVQKKQFLRNVNQFHQLILPHERFAGIIASVQTLGILNLENVGTQTDIPYAQKVANFKFFMDRYGSRSLQVSGPLNLYPVVHLPMVVFDRMNKPNGTHFVGKVAQLAHSMAQENLSTSYALTHVREYREDAQLLGLTSSPSTTTASQWDGFLTRILEAFAFGEITQENVKLAREKLNNVQADIQKAGLRDLDVLVNGIQKEVLSGELFLSVGNAAEAEKRIDKALFLAQSLPKSAPSSVAEKPAEEFLYPVWYAPAYTRENIGKEVYEPLLGVGSILRKDAQSLQAAIEKLIVEYQSVSEVNGNPMDLIDNVVKRPFPTAREVLGFHQHAAGTQREFTDFKIAQDPFGQSAALVAQSLPKEMDTRSERHTLVLAYVQELQVEALVE